MIQINAFIFERAQASSLECGALRRLEISMKHWPHAPPYILREQSIIEINKQDNIPNRKVWYQYWDSKITIHRSYLARLNYVHQNPVKHGIISLASHYPWCSAGQFEMNANRAFVKSIYSFDYSKVKAYDEF